MTFTETPTYTHHCIRESHTDIKLHVIYTNNINIAYSCKVVVVVARTFEKSLKYIHVYRHIYTIMQGRVLHVLKQLQVPVEFDHIYVQSIKH